MHNLSWHHVCNVCLVINRPRPFTTVSGLKVVLRHSRDKKRSEEIEGNGSLNLAIRTTAKWFANPRELFRRYDLWPTSSSPSATWY